MALVDYPSSSDEEEKSNTSQNKDNISHGPSKRKREAEPDSSGLPPLPSKFHDLYTTATRVSTRDDPSLHGGRKRVTPHVEGNWPTHVYIEWYPSTAEHGKLNKLISTIEERLVIQGPNRKIHSFLTSDLGAPLPLHISLSRPIGFLTAQKDTFVTLLERSIKSCGIRPFAVSFSGLDWVSNFESTRWFLVLRLHKPANDGLNRLLQVTNSVVEENGQPPLYTKPSSPLEDTPRPKITKRGRQSETKSSHFDRHAMQDVSSAFHFSIAWMLTEPTKELIETTKSLVEDHFKDLDGIRVGVEEVKSKVGNVVTSISLSRNQEENRSLFGI